MRSFVMPGLPTHLVQELNVGTVNKSARNYFLATLYMHIDKRDIPGVGCAQTGMVSKGTMALMCYADG